MLEIIPNSLSPLRPRPHILNLRHLLQYVTQAKHLNSSGHFPVFSNISHPRLFWGISWRKRRAKIKRAHMREGYKTFVGPHLLPLLAFPSLTAENVKQLASARLYVRLEFVRESFDQFLRLFISIPRGGRRDDDFNIGVRPLLRLESFGKTRFTAP